MFQRFLKNGVGDYVLAIDWELVDINYFDAGFDPLTAHTDDNVRVYSLSSEELMPSGWYFFGDTRNVTMHAGSDEEAKIELCVK